MFSIPPAIAQSTMPSMISWAADAIAWAPEPQTRFTVIAGTSTGKPPWMAACRAGFILLPAWTTLPMTTVSTLAGSSLLRASTARIAVARVPWPASPSGCHRTCRWRCELGGENDGAVRHNEPP